MARTSRAIVTWGLVLALATLVGLLSGARQGTAGTFDRTAHEALVVLSTLDLSSFHATIATVRDNGGEVLQAYPPNAFVVTLNPGAESALRRRPGVAVIERGVADPAALAVLGGQAQVGARIWNTAFRGVPDPAVPPTPPGRQIGGREDFRIAPEGALEEGTPGKALAPGTTQTSEFMAGTIVYSVVFVESSGGSGYCSPADSQTENWSQARRTTVLGEIAAGLNFWTSRADRPSPLTFVLDDRGTQPTSCEPIGHSTDDEGKWIADVLKAMGRSGATPSNYYSEARAYAASRRTALGTDWGYVIFVVDSLADSDGLFSDGYFAYAYLNGPFMMMTYDNDGWGIGYMNLVTAHESGHIFGALDEYASSGCSTADSFGYLNVSNASCNNGGITSDLSIMGDSYEQTSPSVDVSTSARGALGWRNPAQENGQTVVDVVRTATVSLTSYSPDPTTDSTPSYSASAGNTPFPPAGPRRIDGYSYGTASLVSISKVAAAEWRLDGGAFTSDGIFDEESDAYTFTPQSPVANGTHSFGTRLVNNFGHTSSVASDLLTIAAPELDTDGDTIPDTVDEDDDGDGFTDELEAYLGTDSLDACPDSPADAAWPLDMNNDTQISVIGDAMGFRGAIGATPGEPNWSLRLDLNGSGQISVTGDVILFSGMIGQTCS